MQTNKWTPLLIKQLRGKRTLEEFAALISAPKNTVWRWEVRRTQPSAIYIQRLGRLAQREKFFAGWKPIGSITWVGNLKAGSQAIARQFSRTLARAPHRSR